MFCTPFCPGRQSLPLWLLLRCFSMYSLFISFGSAVNSTQTTPAFWGELHHFHVLPVTFTWWQQMFSLWHFEDDASTLCLSLPFVLSCPFLFACVSFIALAKRTKASTQRCDWTKCSTSPLSWTPRWLVKPKHSSRQMYNLLPSALFQGCKQ